MTSYTFRSLTADSRVWDTARLSLYSRKRRTLTDEGRFGEYMAAFRGALLRLFGPPVSTIGDDEYTYLIEATDAHGQTWFLTAYAGPSGPAIGGRVGDPSVYAAAESLLTLIETTPPADFEVSLYDREYDCSVTYGCRNGVCYWQEVLAE